MRSKRGLRTLAFILYGGSGFSPSSTRLVVESLLRCRTVSPCRLKVVFDSKTDDGGECSTGQRFAVSKNVGPDKQNDLLSTPFPKRQLICSKLGRES